MQSLALCLAVSACFLAVKAMSPGYGRNFDYHNLGQLEEAIHRTAGEKNLIEQKMAMLVMQKTELDTALKETMANDFAPADAKFKEQNGRIKEIINKLKEQYHRIGDLEARLAAQAAIGIRTQKWRWTLEEEVNHFAHKSNIQQDATLKEVKAILNRTEIKLNHKLADNAAQRSDAIDLFEVEIDTFNTKVSTRKCFVEVVEVALDPMGIGMKELPFQPVGLFINNTPTVLCGTQGAVIKLQLDHSRPYYSYSDEEKDHVALTVDCKAFSDKVVVNVLDQSSAGQSYNDKNEVMVVYVEVRACSFAALEGF